MAKVLLDIQAFEADFFAGTRLFAIGAPAWADYRFCWLLNRSFGLNFYRTPELDIQFLSARPRRGPTLSLFDFEEEITKQYYFSVFRHDIPFSEASVYVYNNHCLERILIPEWRLADYFLLLPDVPGRPEDNWLSCCMQLPGVSWMKQIAPETIRSKRNFIL